MSFADRFARLCREFPHHTSRRGNYIGAPQIIKPHSFQVEVRFEFGEPPHEVCPGDFLLIDFKLEISLTLLRIRRVVEGVAQKRAQFGCIQLDLQKGHALARNFQLRLCNLVSRARVIEIGDGLNSPLTEIVGANKRIVEVDQPRVGCFQPGLLLIKPRRELLNATLLVAAGACREIGMSLF